MFNLLFLINLFFCSFPNTPPLLSSKTDSLLNDNHAALYSFKTEAKVFTPEMFGASGDGVSRKLSSKYQTLELAKKDYPSATNLNLTIDGAAFQKAIDEAAKVNGEVLAINTYLINYPLQTRDNIIIDGKNTGKIINDRSQKVLLWQNAFFLGNHHAVGFNGKQGSATYNFYNVAEPIKSGQNYILLQEAGGAKNFEVGELIFVGTKAKKVLDVAARHSYTLTMCKITAITNNKLTVELPFDEDIADPEIAESHGNMDAFAGIPLGGVQNVTIRNFTIDARSWASRWFAYKCNIENLKIINGVDLIVGNALSNSTIKNISGTFSRRCIEIKTGTNALVIDGVNATYKEVSDPDNARSAISTGEYCRDVTIKNFKIDMGSLSLGQSVLTIQARKALIEDGEIICKNQRSGVVKFYNDPFPKSAAYGCYDNVIRNVIFRVGANTKTLLSIGSNNPNEIPPTNNTIENCEFIGAAPAAVVALNAGENNVIKNCKFPGAKKKIAALYKNGKLDKTTF